MCRTHQNKQSQPVTKLFPLEVHSEVAPEEADQSSTSSGSQQHTAAAETVYVRTVRAAAVQGHFRK